MVRTGQGWVSGSSSPDPQDSRTRASLVTAGPRAESQALKPRRPVAAPTATFPGLHTEKGATTQGGSIARGPCHSPEPLPQSLQRTSPTCYLPPPPRPAIRLPPQANSKRLLSCSGLAWHWSAHRSPMPLASQTDRPKTSFPPCKRRHTDPHSAPSQPRPGHWAQMTGRPLPAPLSLMGSPGLPASLQSGQGGLGSVCLPLCQQSQASVPGPSTADTRQATVQGQVGPARPRCLSQKKSPGAALGHSKCCF